MSGMTVLLFMSIILQLFISEVEMAVEMGSRSIVPDSVTALDNSAIDACSAFTASGQHQQTKFRFPIVDCAQETLEMTLVGLNLACDQNLYLSPISAVASVSWTGRWQRCTLEWSDTDTVNRQWCGYTCDCSGTCTHVQVYKLPRPGQDGSWSLCSISHQCMDENLALYSPASECAASSVLKPGYECFRAFDSKTTAIQNGYTGWGTAGQGEGAWIQIDFARLVILKHVVVWHFCSSSEQWKTATFLFSDGSSYVASHTCTTSDYYLTCVEPLFERYDMLKPYPRTTYARLTGTDDCNPSGNGGYLELEYWGKAFY